MNYLNPMTTGPASFMRLTRQLQAVAWATRCFGKANVTSVPERANRFLEEAIELAQACNVTEEQIHRLIKRVYGKPVGDQAQEVGGVGLTLLVLCEAIQIDADTAERNELNRVLAIAPEHFRDRHQRKVAEGIVLVPAS
jgi:NTP pyrophosphatase (non-canonical NTP hydrolase)